MKFDDVRLKLHRVGERATIKAVFADNRIDLNRSGNEETISFVCVWQHEVLNWLLDRYHDRAPLVLEWCKGVDKMKTDGWQCEPVGLGNGVITATFVRLLPTMIDARYFNKDGTIGGGYEVGLAGGLKYPISQ